MLYVSKVIKRILVHSFQFNGSRWEVCVRVCVFNVMLSVMLRMRTVPSHVLVVSMAMTSDLCFVNLYRQEVFGSTGGFLIS